MAFHRLCLSVGRCNEVSERERGCPVAVGEQAELSLGSLDLGEAAILAVWTSARPLWRNPTGSRLNFCRFGISPSTSGRREIP
jgi:hypothetical protein